MHAAPISSVIFKDDSIISADKQGNVCIWGRPIGKM
jgi:hypothetical protein